MKTLSDNDLDHLITEFVSNSVIINDEWMPDLIIGIKNAGDVLGRKLYVKIDQIYDHEFNYEVIEFKRRTTSVKDKYFRNLLKYLPSFILYPLRIIENKIYILKDKLNPEKIEIIKRHGNGVKILLVDDSIDSGNTVIKSISYLKEKYPRADIKIFTITVTSNSARIKPDFNFFNKNIIFPWSIDYKKKK